MAAAAFGDEKRVEFITITAFDRFSSLLEGNVDLITQTVTRSMERDLSGLAFSHPYYYSGLVFGGLPEYVGCADRLDSVNGICSGLKVCVLSGTTEETFLAQVRDENLEDWVGVDRGFCFSHFGSVFYRVCV